jgi:integrase
LRKKNVNYKLSQFKGIQAKTGREYTLPINEALWDLIKTAPGDEILDFTGVGRRWKRAVKRAGLRDLQFRDLRRTAATTLHDAGEKLRTISAMLGHGAVTTTIRYLGLKDENLKQAGDILAGKYRTPADPENVSFRVQSVPESVPQGQRNDDDRNDETY